MKTVNTLITLILSVFLINACSLFSLGPDEPSYEYQRENHRLLRCKLNGEEWYSHVCFLCGPVPQWEYFANPNHELYRHLRAHGRYIPNESIKHKMYFDIDSLVLGVNMFDNNGKRIFADQAEIPGISYYIDSDLPHQFYVTEIDTINEIIKGTFYFTATTEDNSLSIEVTDGEFDWKPYWYK